MSKQNKFLIVLFLLCVPPVALSQSSLDGRTITGETLDPSTYGRGIIEDFDDVLARAAIMRPPVHKGQLPEQGFWAVPSMREADYPRNNGNLYAFNKWGDPQIGIRFPEPVDVRGALVFGPGTPQLWTTGLRVVGYRDGAEVAATDWFREIGEHAAWFRMDLRNVDRIEFQAEPVRFGAGYFAIDDLTFTHHGPAAVTPEDVTVVDFQDLSYHDKLSGRTYAGLTWEQGTGELNLLREIPPPAVPPGYEPAEGDYEELRSDPPRNGGTLPGLESSFNGVQFGEDGQFAYPPDSCGAVGTTKYMVAVNSNVAVYWKNSGNKQTGSSIYAFFPDLFPGDGQSVGGGDPRVVFDHHSQRWIVIATDFSGGEKRIHLAVSYNFDPASLFFKTSFIPGQGSDAGRWSDYPTLGVDQNGIYITTYMVGGGLMTAFAIDKAPLIAWPPSLGTITAFRGLTWEGAIQPCYTYGTPSGEYLVSVHTSSQTHIRVRRINPPITAPTMTEVGYIPVGFWQSPPDAPCKGGGVLDTVGDRLMMSMYRDGSIWTAHAINYNGRAACRWYELDPVALSLVQRGTVADDSLYYFFPSIAVNSAGHVAMAFSGCDSDTYAGCYYTGRKASDPLEAMATPAVYRTGVAGYDIGTVSRWGDYSYTCVDPADDLTFWTIQEYAKQADTWGTYIAELAFGPDVCRGDASCDGEVDFGDINPFVDAMLCVSDPDPEGCWAALYPDCPYLNADVSNNDVVDFGDINPFVDLLTTSSLPILCP